MLDTLFGLIPAESKGQQWVAEELQLVNWGGYDGGPHRVRFAPGATLLCGGSGSGKSTLMDAYIALMMPHTTPFNGASNGGVAGRARGEEQRNILSYGRGKQDETRTESGTHVTVLRGDGVDTWTAIAATWRDHDGSCFTAVRAWYIPAGARLVEDTVRVRATVHGAYELSRLEAAAAQRLSDSSVRAAGLETAATDREFSARIQSVLGIGAAGAGSKAMSLLARIQAGQQITTVDELYKRMVLEEPETLATADAVVSHFDELDGTRSRMVTAQKQVRALRPLRGMRERIEEAAERLRLLDEVGQASDPASLLSLWRTGHRLELLRETETVLQRAKRDADDAVRIAQAQAEAAEAQRDALSDVLRQAGGDRLETAERELRDVERRLDTVSAARARFEARTAALETSVSTAKDFAALGERARTELDSGDAKASAREAFVAARQELAAAQEEAGRLDAELATLLGRADNIPTALHEARADLAHAAGLSPEDLPFVGELVEVRTEFEPWREAFNLALGGFATTLLIDTAHLARFRAAIDSVPTRIRVLFEGVQTGLPLASGLDPAQLPGRLDYKEGPFAGWLQQRLEQRFPLVCVDSAGELSQHAQALSINGQTSSGSRGAHGGQGRGNVLGFSNEHALAELNELLDVAAARLTQAQSAEALAAQELDSMEARLAAYNAVVSVSWDEIDVRSVQKDQQRWHDLIAEVTEGNPEIERLKSQLAQAKKEAQRLLEAIGRAKSVQEIAEAQWARNTDEVDQAQEAVDLAEDQGRELTPEQAAFLAGRFAQAGNGAGAGLSAGSADGDAELKASVRLARFDAALGSASERLAEDQEAAQATLGEQREGLRRVLESFLESWPNPNLRADPDTSVPDFERILQELESSGLHELEGEWKQSLMRLSGNDLTSLDSTLGRALREIRERIEPVNQIMEDLPFYDDEHRLQITARENHSEATRGFRKELREVRRLISEAQDDAAREAVYPRMAKLIGKIRRSSPDFSELVDVRNHVRVSAEKIRADTKEHVALFDHIGEKSGGESQELIAFIVGAALRYQLGDPDAQRPRYAPVFLDEALIKADAYFTKRAIGAWRGLGFQLIIGAPNDKYSAIEPHVEAEYDILKDTSGRSWARPKVGLAPTR